MILGSGPAGLTAALFAGQAHLNPLVIKNDSSDSQFLIVNRMENYPGFPEGISGKELAEKIEKQASCFGARFQMGEVIDVDFVNYPYRLSLSDGETIYSESVILANGSQKKWLGLPSEKALKGRGVYGSSTQFDRYQGKHVVVAGAGDSAMEEALNLAKKASKVAIVHTGDKFHAAAYLQERVFSHEKIEIFFNTAINEILDVSKGCVTALVLQDNKTMKKKVYACDALIVSLGYRPNTDLFKGQLEINEKGVLILDAHSSKTSKEGIFAAGDVSDSTYRKTITATAGGCKAAIDASSYLKNKKIVLD